MGEEPVKSDRHAVPGDAIEHDEQHGVDHRDAGDGRGVPPADSHRGERPDNEHVQENLRP